MRTLMVMTSHDRPGHTRQKTGVWLEEFAAPYYVFKDADVELTLASPKGGKPPIDPRSETPNAQTPATRHFKGDKDAQAAFSASSVLRTVAGDDFDAVFYPGGHGPLWDLAEDRASIDLIEVMWFEEKFVAAVCHGPGVFRHTKKPDGTPLVKAKSITGLPIPKKRPSVSRMSCRSWSRKCSERTGASFRRQKTGIRTSSSRAIWSRARTPPRPNRRRRRFCI
jgi:putative intracellular protease/amidase